MNRVPAVVLDGQRGLRGRDGVDCCGMGREDKHVRRGAGRETRGAGRSGGMAGGRRRPAHSRTRIARGKGVLGGRCYGAHLSTRGCICVIMLPWSAQLCVRGAPLKLTRSSCAHTGREDRSVEEHQAIETRAIAGVGPLDRGLLDDLSSQREGKKEMPQRTGPASSERRKSHAFGSPMQLLRALTRRLHGPSSPSAPRRGLQARRDPRNRSAVSGYVERGALGNARMRWRDAGRTRA